MEAQANFIIPMIKNQTANKNDNQLLLNKLNDSCHFGSVEVDFSPLTRNDSKAQSALPKFNVDRCYFTPCFVLEMDEDFYANNFHFEKLKFQERIQNASQKQVQKNNHNFSPAGCICQVCQATYLDYMEHINTAAHQAKVQNSSANLFIRDLNDKFTETQTKSKKIHKLNDKSKPKLETSLNGRPQRKCAIKFLSEAQEMSRKTANWTKSSNQASHLISLVP